MTETTWTLGFFVLFFGLEKLGRNTFPMVQELFSRSQQKDLRSTYDRLIEIEEMLLGGLVPSSEQWESIRNLPHPWGNLIYPSLMDLRSAGAALIPTLKRLRQLVEGHRLLCADAHAKSIQSFVQALFCLGLIPLLGTLLFFLLPELDAHLSIWIGICLLALLSGGIGAIWVQTLAEAARWGGLQGDSRHWILGSLCMGERFLAFIRVGIPPDQAWLRACGDLKDSSLVEVWGHSVWEILPRSDFRGLQQKIATAGLSIKKSIQVSLMEGRPCLDRVESALSALREDIRIYIEKELAVLPTQTLKPLFIFVAPALLGLIGAGIWMIFPAEL